MSSGVNIPCEGFNMPWVGCPYTRGRGVDIARVGGRYSMAMGDQYTLAREVDTPWVGGRYTMCRGADIPCVGVSIYHG